MTNDPFASPKRRVTLAKQHLKTLDRGIDEFLANNQYSAVIEKDADGKREIYKLCLADAPPIV